MQKNNILATLSTLVMALVMCFTLVPSVARAEERPTYTYNNGEYTITASVSSVDHLSITGIYGEYPMDYYLLDYGFDQYGTLWCINLENNVEGWNYYLQHNDDWLYWYYVKNIAADGSKKVVNDAASLVFDENNQYVVGYKTLSGEEGELPSYEEVKNKADSNPKLEDQPSPSPSPTVAPTANPTPTPNQQVTPSTPAVVNPTSTPGTVQPNNGEEPQVNSTKITLKKKGNTTSLYKGNTIVSKFTLKKGVLKYKGRTYKNVKSAGFIKKSQNLIFMNKKGKVFTINAKGKKKTILKKNAKKLVFKSGYVTKVKKKSGSLNVAGK